MSDNKSEVRKILDKVKAEGRTSLTAPEGKLVCDAYGIAVPKEGVATSAAEAAKLASGMGFPVVLKIVSPDIAHKTEAGGVALGLANEAALRAALPAMQQRVAAARPGARLEGFVLARQLAGGVEWLVGTRRDPVFGPVVTVGAGGVVRSDVIVTTTSEFVLPAASCTEPASNLTVTSPSAVGVTSKVYVRASTCTNLEIVPFCTFRSPTSKPVMSSLNVTVNGMTARLVGSVAVVVIVALGLKRSELMLRLAASLPLPATSWAAPAAIVTVTRPSDVGATSKVYVRASTITKLDAVPLVTTMSLNSNPVTSSSNVTVNGIGDVPVGFGSVVVIVATGATVSIINPPG